MGWRKEGNYRRFNRAFTSMSKNGYIASGMAANALIMEQEPAERASTLDGFAPTTAI